MVENLNFKLFNKIYLGYKLALRNVPKLLQIKLTPTELRVNLCSEDFGTIKLFRHCERCTSAGRHLINRFASPTPSNSAVPVCEPAYQRRVYACLVIEEVARGYFSRVQPTFVCIHLLQANIPSLLVLQAQPMH